MENKKRLRVGILFGGRSGEHEVSLASAASVIRALDTEKYEAVPIGITKDGRWLVGPAAQKMTEQKMLPELLKTGERVVLPPDPSASALVPLAPGNTQPSVKVDVIFPVLHGTFGEDGTVQGLLDLAGVPYVGSGVLGSAVGMDKDVQKRLFRDAKIPIVEYLCFTRHKWETNRGKTLVAIKKKFRFPLFVKPATLGSSVGMTRVHEAAELPAAMDLAASFALKILVERAIRGREIEVAVLGNEDPRASVPGEIIPHREYYDYSAKYLESGSQIEIPAKLSKTQTAQFQEYAIRGYRSIECAGMARVDFFLERGTKKIYLNEINTIPGFTSISMYPKMWEASGVPYKELISRLIELAIEQHAEKSRTKYSIELPEGAGGALEG